MKVFKKVIPTVCMLLVAAVLMGTSTYAWFSMNTKVTTDGMKIKATTPSYLVISTDGDFSKLLTTATFEEDTVELMPMTITNGTGYQHVSNYGDVDKTTGLALTGKTLTLVNLPGETDGYTYYKDYEIFIAAVGEKMEGQALKATVDFGTVTDTQCATTIQFFIGTDLAYDKSVASVAACDTDKTVQLSTGIDIPSNATCSLKITMRVYIDGAKKRTDDSTKCYVTTATANVEDLDIAVDFELGTVA